MRSEYCVPYVRVITRGATDSSTFSSRGDHPYCTVNFRAIEIDLQEAVSRFLNVHGGNRADSQSISKCAVDL